jgi:hypothetical protein
MRARNTILALGLLPLALGPLSASAGIFRCAEPGMAVSYQEMPCADPSMASTLDVPTEYPAIDAQKRDRLLQREAALDQRLEARRERESRETIATIGRDAQVQAAEAEAEAAAAAYFMAWPHAPGLRLLHRAHRPPRHT